MEKERPGLVAQQEIDDAKGKDLALEAQVEAGKPAYQTAQSQVDEAKAKQQRDKVMFDYARITAPFAGIVTQRFANQGALMQAGTSSSTQTMPLVRLSQDDLFRLVVPVPESYVKYIRIGDPVQVRVPSLDEVVPGVVKRFSVDVAADTRTIHTEVDVLNPSGTLRGGHFNAGAEELRPRCAASGAEPGGRSGHYPSGRSQQHAAGPEITLGLETAADAEVLSGLNEGDRVRSGLKAGLRVKPQAVEVLQYQADNSQ